MFFGVRSDAKFSRCTDLGNLVVRRVQTDRRAWYPLSWSVSKIQQGHCLMTVSSKLAAEVSMLTTHRNTGTDTYGSLYRCSPRFSISPGIISFRPRTEKSGRYGGTQGCCREELWGIRPNTHANDAPPSLLAPFPQTINNPDRQFAHDLQFSLRTGTRQST